MDNVEEIADRVVAVVRTRAASLAAFPYEQHLADSVLSVRTILEGLSSGAGPNADALAHAEAIGRDRARYGVPLIDAIEGYHVAAAEIWGYLFDRASEHGPDVVAGVSASVAPLWGIINRISISFTTAHAAETSRLAAGQHQVRSRLVALLREGAPDSGLATTLVTQLGFDNAGEFTVVLTEPTSPSVVDLIQERAAVRGGIANCALDEESRAILIGQGLDPEWVTALMSEMGLRAGVGITRAGVAGAALSIADAALALATADAERPVARFEDSWITAVLVAEPQRVSELLDIGVEAATSHPHLADAVVAFAEHRFSLTSAASVLHVHPNTARYRLSRWEELTGWDAFSMQGLVASIVAIRLAAIGESDRRRP